MGLTVEPQQSLVRHMTWPCTVGPNVIELSSNNNQINSGTGGSDSVHQPWTWSWFKETSPTDNNQINGVKGTTINTRIGHSVGTVVGSGVVVVVVAVVALGSAGLGRKTCETSRLGEQCHALSVVVVEELESKLNLSSQQHQCWSSINMCESTYAFRAAIPHSCGRTVGPPSSIASTLNSK